MARTGLPPRGDCLSLPTIKAIASAREKAKTDHPRLQSVGRARLVLSPSVKRTSGIKVLKMPKAGGTPAEIASSKTESRKWGASKTARKEAKNVKKAEKLLG